MAAKFREGMTASGESRKNWGATFMAYLRAEVEGLAERTFTAVDAAAAEMATAAIVDRTFRSLQAAVPVTKARIPPPLKLTRRLVRIEKPRLRSRVDRGRAEPPIWSRLPNRWLSTAIVDTRLCAQLTTPTPQLVERGGWHERSSAEDGGRAFITPELLPADWCPVSSS